MGSRKMSKFYKYSGVAEVKEDRVLNVKIITLGNFDILEGEQSILQTLNKRSYKIFELLKFFITFKDQKLLSETIVQKLWPDNDLQDPKNALRTQIYRLRKMLKNMGIMQEQEELGACRLAFESGFYVFSLNKNTVLDSDKFCELIKKGNELKHSNPQQAITYYSQALGLYRGEYLSENLYSEWVIPARNRYHRLYFRALLQQLELLKKAENYRSMLETCEDSFQIDLYEESVHVYYLEALLQLNQIKQATSHYKYITTKLYQELGVKPSPLLREIYLQIRQNPANKNDRKFDDIIRSLKDEELQEQAFYCEIDEFKAIYNLERRKSIRKPSNCFLGVITLINEGRQLDSSKQKTIMQKIKNILLCILRKGDVVTQWNNGIIMFIVTDISWENLSIISRRIENRYNREIGEEDLILKIKYEAIDEKLAIF